MLLTHRGSFLALASLWSLSLPAQQLATFDPASVTSEFAAVPCPPAPPLGWTDSLVSPPAAPSWWFGAIAADNVNQRLYYTTGLVADGIQRIPFASIGTAAAPTVYATPPGFNQVTGMVVDPTVAAGDVLFVIDGWAIARYHAPSATILAGPFTLPAPAGMAFTGIGYNPADGRVYIVDDSSAMWARPVGGGAWAGPVTAAVAVPPRATGIAFDRAHPGTPYVSYWNGLVQDPITGATLPFPGGATGIRHHRGMTFFGVPVNLRGGGLPPKRPVVDVRNGIMAGNPNTTLGLIGPGAPMLLLVDLAPTFGAGAVIPGVGGRLLVNPASSFSVLFGPGSYALPLSLVGVPPGIGLTFQAAAMDPGGVELSEAVHFTTHG